MLWEAWIADAVGPPGGSGVWPKHRQTESKKLWIWELFIVNSYRVQTDEKNFEPVYVSSPDLKLQVETVPFRCANDDGP